jgi:hypothetical protein
MDQRPGRIFLVRDDVKPQRAHFETAALPDRVASSSEK